MGTAVITDKKKNISGIDIFKFGFTLLIPHYEGGRIPKIL